MAGLTDVHLPTVAQGVGLQVAITVPAVLIIRAVTQDDTANESNLPVLAAFLALAVAPAVSGGFAARARRAAPYLHAVVTTGLGWLVLAIVTVVRLAARSDHGLDAATVLPLFALVEVGVGVCAAYVTTRSTSSKEGHAP